MNGFVGPRVARLSKRSYKKVVDVDDCFFVEGVLQDVMLHHHLEEMTGFVDAHRDSVPFENTEFGCERAITQASQALPLRLAANFRRTTITTTT